MESTGWCSMAKTKEIVEFGDFQTPDSLTNIIIDILAKKNISPTVIIEPTCGIGLVLNSS